MPRKYSEEYIDRLVSAADYDSLVDLSSAICSVSTFTIHQPTYGLPVAAFVFTETLQWFTQAIRSGVWTYYEATPLERQSAMLSALREFAPADFRDCYAQGIRDWQDEVKIMAVDDWIERNEERANEWLRSHVRSNRPV